MPDTRVEDEVELLVPDGTEIYYCVFGGAPRRVTGATMRGIFSDPISDDSDALGTTLLRWSDLFLAPGAVVNWGSSDVLLTHSADLLTFSGASNGYSFDQNLLIASGKGINWNGGDVTILHSANLLAFAGASSGYTFDAVIKGASNDAVDLGANGTAFKDFYIGSTRQINWGGGDVTIACPSNQMNLSGASNGYRFDAMVSPQSSDGAALGSTSLMWSDAFFATGAVINFNNGNLTLTHGTNGLAIASAGGLAGNLGAFVQGSTYDWGFSTGVIGGACKNSATTGTVGMIQWFDGAGTNCGSVAIDAAANTTAYITSSDKRGKRYRKRITNALDLINQLEVWDHTDKRNLINGYGVLAQDAYKILPQMVIPGRDEKGEIDTGTKDVKDADETPDGVHLWGADYAKAVPHLIAAVQELTKEVALLKKQLAKRT